MRIAHLPTPLEPLPRLTDHLGGPRLSVKREDCTGLAGGGNKARKLDRLMDAALAAGADVVVTSGALQSNHCRMTAAACARAGLECELVLDVAVTGAGEPYRTSGNVLLDELLGARIVLPGELPAETPGLVARPVFGSADAFLVTGPERRAEQLRAEGRTPYVIPPGGSSPVGASAYAACAREIAEQAPDATAIVTATTTGGTQAGLHAAASCPVIGVSAALDAATTIALVAWLAGEVAREEGLPEPGAAPQVDDRFLGPGYGVPTDAGRDAAGVFARLEGLVLDPVYSAKAAAGLLAMVAEGRFGAADHVVFVHTGGLPSLFAYPRGAVLG